MPNIKILEVFKNDTWVKPFFTKYKTTLFWALFLGFMTLFSATALMFVSGYLISRSASNPYNILEVYVPVVLTRAFGIARPSFNYAERLVSHNWVLKMTSRLRLKLYEVMESDAIFFKRHYRTGDILGLLAEDINYIQNLYLRTIFPTIIAWLLYAFVIIGLGFFSWTFALVMLFLLGVEVVVVPYWSVVINGARRERQKAIRNDLYNRLTDNILGVSDWIFSRQGAEYVTLHEETEKEWRQVNEKMNAENRKRDFIVQVLFGVIAVLTLIWASQRFVGVEGDDANWIAAFVLAVFPLADAFAPLSDAAEETNTYGDSIVRLNSLESKPQVTPTDQVLEGPITIDIKDLTYTYDAAAGPVLDHLNLTFKAGEKIAVLGRSGSGKSTLLNLLRGDLSPQSGAIEMNGIPVTQFGDDIAKYIGVLQQTPYLFHTSILNNLHIGNQDATEEEAWDALERVGLKDLIAALPEGLETMIDEAGLRFSGGERHRLALARLILQDAPIILLDEPTVGLDPITEQALIQTFFNTLSDKTIIWVTHHLQGVQMADRVIFIEDGHLTMSGSPEALSATNEHYQKLMTIDAGAFLDRSINGQ
ncbi:thiol reductant ABC exporter subunit CydC [Aerococcus sp. 1KP-2016]|uniref:thiol reductant ABC exporter subunit CydC n=1 Tax=Aerococcus sp. 1KP-2016 TaxID=1981982 RepID=UPI000B9823F8|nr:thiol reductant ABC exporter subunit CydC [Aerococcus sp. 1KP-2016]OYQ66884.1 thiol reductant ABC exporter subunit CydC [Aerococcus sp. 1KP-2016]